MSDADIAEMRKRLAELGVHADVLYVANIRMITVDELRTFAQRHAAASGSAELSLVAEVLFLRYVVSEYRSIEVRLGAIERKVGRVAGGKTRHRRRR